MLRPVHIKNNNYKDDYNNKCINAHCGVNWAWPEVNFGSESLTLRDKRQKNEWLKPDDGELIIYVFCKCSLYGQITYDLR